MDVWRHEQRIYRDAVGAGQFERLRWYTEGNEDLRRSLCSKAYVLGFRAANLQTPIQCNRRCTQERTGTENINYRNAARQRSGGEQETTRAAFTAVSLHGKSLPRRLVEQNGRNHQCTQVRCCKDREWDERLKFRNKSRLSLRR